MAALAAGSHPVIEPEIIADRRNPGERRGPVADQGRILHGILNLPAFDPIGLGALEHEFARCNVHLPATEIDGIEPAIEAFENLGGVAFARQHESVGHAWHGQMGIAFAPAIAGRRDIGQARIHAVLEKAFQDPVLDQNGPPGRRAFIVMGQRAPPSR